MNIMHLPYIILILFSNKLYEKIIFYLIFIFVNSNIEYKNKVITKLYIYLNCYKNNLNYLQLAFITSVVNEEYEKGMALASIVYYFYTDIITNINIFWYIIIIIYLYIGSNITPTEKKNETKLYKIIKSISFSADVNDNIKVANYNLTAQERFVVFVLFDLFYNFQVFHYFSYSIQIPFEYFYIHSYHD